MARNATPETPLQANDRASSSLPIVTDAPVLADVVAVLDALYDPRTAEEWDAVGLVTGDPDQPVRRVLFAVDPVDAVISEAVAWGADLLVTHHPLLLRGVHSVATDGPKGRAVTALVRAGVALHVAHTNADVARPGVSDALAELLGHRGHAPAATDGRSRRWTRSWSSSRMTPSKPWSTRWPRPGPAGSATTSGPPSSATGTGTFRPLPGANPAVGRVGAIERVAETRLEMVAAAQPGWPPSSQRCGQRIPTRSRRSTYCSLALSPATAAWGESAACRSQRRCARSASGWRPPCRVRRRACGSRATSTRSSQTVAVCGGAGDDLFDDVRRAGADVFVTADLRHHPASESLAHGSPALVDCAHWATEWPWLGQAAARVAASVDAAGDYG